jgi:hypothetical protein
MSILSLTSKELRRAAQLKDQVEELQNELARLIGGGGATPVKTAKPKRTMSRAARAKIAAAQRARWARQKGSKPSAKPAPRKKWKMSAAARARISAAAKARWVKAKAAGKTRLS